MPRGEKSKLLWQNPEYREKVRAGYKPNPISTAKLIMYSRSPKARESVSLRFKGKAPWNKGKKQLNITGENHYLWKGAKVSYGVLHHWVRRHLGKATRCVKCGIQKKCKDGRSYVQWANISGKYKRTLADWKQLCYLCHQAFDSRGNRKVNQ